MSAKSFWQTAFMKSSPEKRVAAPVLRRLNSMIYSA